MKEVYIVSATRTPMGSFNGVFSEISAPHLAAFAIKGALSKINLNPNLVEEVFMGNVLQAGIGQAPARQAAIYGGLSKETPCTTVNKVCASGMKAIALAAQSIQTGDNQIVLAGGMENMTQTPYYLKNARNGYKYGEGKILDGLVFDGLTDVYNNYQMGVAAELCAKKYSITREEQDNYALESYKRSANAWQNGKFTDEITPVEIISKKGEKSMISEDEEYKKIFVDKVRTLKPVFEKEGTITAANASTINDGASALILMSKEQLDKLNIKPLAKIVSFADAAQEPEWFTTAPAKAIPKALAKAGLSISDIDYFEINEAFSVVALANNKLLNIDGNKVNIHGGAVSLGHPLGNSGSRILVTLIHVLKQQNAKFGVAGICNGGGGASAMVIENIRS